MSKLVDWERFAEHRASALMLIATNVLPLLGVLFWGWSTFAVVFIYWAENVVLGVINVLRMIFCAPNDTQGESATLGQAAKFFFVPFFSVHYGIFCLVHGMFVFILLGDGWELLGGGASAVFEESGTLLALAGLAISHLFSFVSNYLMRGEFRRTNLQQLMFKPYARIVVLHLAILFGAFGTMLLGSPIWILLILIVGKTVLDLALHLREHSAMSEYQGDQGHDGKNRGNEGFGTGA